MVSTGFREPTAAPDLGMSRAHGVKRHMPPAVWRPRAGSEQVSRAGSEQVNR